MTYHNNIENKYKRRDKGLGRREPVSFGLIRAVAGLRKASLQGAGEAESDYKNNLVAKDLVILGKLINAWRDVVGVQLASKTCPTKLFKGKLYLIVSDSQWMQTLLFIKGEIVEKLKERFPDIKIDEIIGRIGKIPSAFTEMVKEASWPDWKEEEVTEKFGVKDPELAKSIDICQQKLSARLKGLESKGYRLCSMCRANVTRSSDGICAMCLFDNRSNIRMKARSIMAETPWLSYNEVCEFQSELTQIEYEGIKNELLNESLRLIKELAAELVADFDEDSATMIRKEMVRAITLFTGETPDKIDLSSLKENQVLDKNWTEYLSLISI